MSDMKTAGVKSPLSRSDQPIVFFERIMCHMEDSLHDSKIGREVAVP